MYIKYVKKNKKIRFHLLFFFICICSYYVSYRSKRMLILDTYYNRTIKFVGLKTRKSSLEGLKGEKKQDSSWIQYK